MQIVKHNWRRATEGKQRGKKKRGSNVVSASPQLPIQRLTKLPLRKLHSHYPIRLWINQLTKSCSWEVSAVQSPAIDYPFLNYMFFVSSYNLISIPFLLSGSCCITMARQQLTGPFPNGYVYNIILWEILTTTFSYCCSLTRTVITQFN